MATKKKKKRNPKRSVAKKRPAKRNASRKPATKKRSGKKNTHHAKKATRRPNPTNVLRQKIAGMKPGRFYDSTLSGAKIRIKRVGQTLVIRPKAKR